MAVKIPADNRDQVKIIHKTFDTNLLHHSPSKHLPLDSQLQSRGSQGDCPLGGEVGDLGGPGWKVGGSLGRSDQGVALGTGGKLHILGS